MTLELGGKSANIVFADADLEQAAAAAPVRASSTTPARTAAPAPGSWSQRVGVRPVPGAAGAGGHGVPGARTRRWTRAEMGPLISAGQRDVVASYVDGADVAFRGSRPTAPGFWYPPTVLLAHDRRTTGTGARRSSARCVSVLPFDDEADAIRLANDTEYGLSGSIWTRDVGRALRVARGGRDRQPERQLALVGALLDAVRRHEAVRPRPRARPGRAAAFTEVKNVFISHGGVGGRVEGRLAGPGRGHHRGGQRHRAGHRAAVRRRGRPGGRASTSTTAAGQAAADEVGGEFVALRRHRRGGGRGAVRRRGRATHGRVDIAFNNAGISPPDDDSILDTGLDAWERVQRVNLTAVYLCCKYAIPHMQRQGKGSIINTASFVALMGAATSQISYTASKGGVLAMTRELGVQFAREGIRVNALCPGPVNTPLLHGAVRQGPGAGRPAAGAHPDGPVRRAGGDRRRGGLPGQRRRLVHHRVARSSSTAASPART